MSAVSDAVLAEYLAREAALIARYGWVVRAITDTPWAYTVGLATTYGHPDVSLRLAVPPQDRQRFLNVFGTAVKGGRRFSAPAVVFGLFAVPVRLVAVGARLHAVFPDARGRWPDDPGCAPGSADQLIFDGP
jgi:hypothetical protein